MPPAPQKLQPALYGGVFIGVLSALPVVSAGNVCYFGYPDRQLWVRLEPGGHESAHRTFGT